MDKMTPKMHPKRLKALDDSKTAMQEVKIEQVRQYLKEDFLKISYTVDLILRDEKLLDVIAEHMHSKIKTAGDQISQAVEAQRSQAKAD